MEVLSGLALLSAVGCLIRETILALQTVADERSLAFLASSVAFQTPGRVQERVVVQPAREHALGRVSDLEQEVPIDAGEALLFREATVQRGKESGS